MNFWFNEYFKFSFELNIELNHFWAQFNVWMNNRNVSARASSKQIPSLVKLWMFFKSRWQEREKQQRPSKTKTLNGGGSEKLFHHKMKIWFRDIEIGWPSNLIGFLALFNNVLQLLLHRGHSPLVSINSSTTNYRFILLTQESLRL